MYHSPPEGLLRWTGSRHFGDPEIEKWIGRWSPELVLTGHIHQSPFTESGSWIDRVGETRLFNAGNQIGSEPAHIEIDLDRDVARWVSLAGVEEETLATAVQ